MSEAREWLESEYEELGELLFIGFREELREKEVVCTEQIREWKDYLEEEFAEDELENFVIAETQFPEKYSKF